MNLQNVGTHDKPSCFASSALSVTSLLYAGPNNARNGFAAVG